MDNVMALSALVAGILLASLACNVLPVVPESTIAPPNSSMFITGKKPGTPLMPAPVRFLDISYPSPGSSGNQLDLYIPPGGISGPATILYIHGGGWCGGDKSDTAELAGLLTAGSFPVVTCDYTLSTLFAPGFPQAIYDVKAVVHWIRTDGAVIYGLPMKIVALGDSAGGHLAEMLGTTAGIQRFEPLPPPPGGYRMDAVIAFFAPGDLVYLAQHGSDGLAAIVTAMFIGGLLNDETLPRYQEASPITYVSVDDPPMALFHGLHDAVVPCEASVRTKQVFVDVSRPCYLLVAPDDTADVVIKLWFDL